MTDLPAFEVIRSGGDHVPPAAAAFLREHVRQRHGLPDGEPLDRLVGLLVAGAADPKAVTKRLREVDETTATAPTIAVSRARGIDLPAWALLLHLGLNYKIRSPFSMKGTGAPERVDDALFLEAGGGINYDIAIGDGASWMETPTPTLVLEVATFGRLPETAIISMEGRLLREFVSNPMLDSLDLVVNCVMQDEFAIEIEIANERQRYLVPAPNGRVYPKDERL